MSTRTTCRYIAPSFKHWNFLKNNFAFSTKEIARHVADASQVVRNVLRLEGTLGASGYFTCVHAQPAPLTLAMMVESQFSGHPNHRRLRDHHTKYARPAQQVRQELEQAFLKGQDDSNPAVGDYLISANYSYFNTFQAEESASWWAFNANSGQRGVSAARQMLRSSLKIRGFAPQRLEALVQAAEPILQSYTQLDIANLVVVGIPYPLVDKVAYDAGAYGKPTGRNVRCGHLEKMWEEAYPTQLRLVMSEELLEPQHGVVVAIANQVDAVAQICGRIPACTSAQEMQRRAVDRRAGMYAAAIVAEIPKG